MWARVRVLIAESNDHDHVHCSVGFAVTAAIEPVARPWLQSWGRTVTGVSAPLQIYGRGSDQFDDTGGVLSSRAP